MNDLIGYKRAASQLARRISEQMESVRPYMAFSIRGKRRSGRTEFFSQVAEDINTESSSCRAIVAQLENADPECFAKTICTSIQNRYGSNHDYLQYQSSLTTAAGFFSLCAAFNQNEIFAPVLLVDMGGALDDAFSKKGTEGVNGITRLLRQIFNLLQERNIRLSLGIGTTLEFVKQAEDFAGDVYLHRYQPSITLTNSQLEDPRDKNFQEIVRSISDVSLPDALVCLWRGDLVCPAQFAENLVANQVSNMDAETAWTNLRGVWNIIENTSVAGISSSDLGRLLLSDAIFTENKYPNWLENCDDGYRATDGLYESFGLISPRRDPSVKDRLVRRIQDPDDDQILHEILSSICGSLTNFGLNDFGEQKYLGKKSASVHANLTSLTSLKIDDTDREIYESVLPRDLLLVLFLSSTPAEDDLEKMISEQCQKNGFVLVFYLEGVDLGRIPFGRFLKELGVKSVFSLSFEAIAQLLSNSNEAVGNVIGEWIAQTTKDLFSKKPPLGINHPVCRAMISATVSEGVVAIDAFARQRNISQSDAKKALAHLVDPPILIKKGNEISWDPSQDVILKVLMESGPNLVAINNQLRKMYLTPTVDMSMSDLLTPYEGISGDLSCEAIIEHTNESLSFHLGVAIKALENEATLREEWMVKINALRSRNVSRLDEVAPFRSDVLRLRSDVESALKDLQDRRNRDSEELENRKQSVKSQLGGNKDSFRPPEYEELVQKLDDAQVISSNAFKQVEVAIRKRRQDISDLRSLLENASNRFAKVKPFISGADTNRCEKEIGAFEKLIASLDLETALTKRQAVDEILTELEDACYRKSILARQIGTSREPQGTSETDGQGQSPSLQPPSLQPPSLQPPSLQPPSLQPPSLQPQIVNEGGTVSPPNQDVNVWNQEEYEPIQEYQEFNLNKPEERRKLLSVLIERRAIIRKIEISIND